MPDHRSAFLDFVTNRPPFDLLPVAALEQIAAQAELLEFRKGAAVYRADAEMAGFYVVHAGAVDALGQDGGHLARLGPGDCFGARSLLRGGVAATDAVAARATTVFLVPRASADVLFAAHPDFAAFFDHARTAAPAISGPDQLLSVRIADLMTPEPITVSPDTTVGAAAVVLRDRRISCLPVTQGGRLVGILTAGDIAARVVAEGRDAQTAVGAVMTPEPMVLGPDALGFDALVAMTERGISHLPVAEDGRLKGIVTATNLVRRQAVSAVFLVGDIAKHDRFEDFAEVVGRIPGLLAQLVGTGVGAHQIGRIVTSVADALTRRLLVLAEARLGPPPVPYVWAACGSQGRREQTGISDQDNCLILSDDYDPQAHGGYFAELARHASDGLAAAGYFYCPGDMMATNPRWRQPLSVWQGYFRKWIAQPDDEAQMLASVMFDLRAIAGEVALLDALQGETLERARRNSIFRAHMVRNSLKHHPPLGLLRGFALIRSGEHKDRIDMKHNGVVPVTDLARVYALMGGLRDVGTRDRLVAGRAAGVISEAGAGDLLDAWDLIADLRLAHQARLIREGRKPDNFMAPATLSDLERNHLRDAFLVVRTMQSALANSHGLGG